MSKKVYRIFIINPGSTSTKLSLFENRKNIFTTDVFHDSSVLLTFPTINDQLEYRMEVIHQFLEEDHIDLTGISLSAQASTDWEVTFDQDTIDSIAAGESAEVTAHITPAKDAILGDYVTAITASNEAVSSECDLRVSVQNHTSWGIVAVAIIAALVLGLAVIIRRFGRR